MAEEQNVNNGVQQVAAQNPAPAPTPVQNPTAANPQAPTGQPTAAAAGIQIMTNGQPLSNTQTPTEPTAPKTGEQNPNGTAPTEQNVQQVVDDRNASTEQAKKLLSEKKIDYTALQNEYDSKGALSEETFKKLEEAGLPKQMVEGYIKGLEAQAEVYTNAVINFAGGRDNYSQMQNFVKGQGEQAVQAFNNIIETGNVAMVSQYLAGVKAQMAAKYGTANPTVLGTGTTPVNQGFANAGEMVAAMSDKRYGYDENYTKQVQAKLQLSTNIVR